MSVCVCVCRCVCVDVCVCRCDDKCATSLLLYVLLVSPCSVDSMNPSDHHGLFSPQVPIFCRIPQLFQIQIISINIVFTTTIIIIIKFQMMALYYFQG